MLENDFNSPDFGEIMELIQQYEEAVKANSTLNFSEEDFEKIIVFYQDNHEFKKAMTVANSALEFFPFSAEFLIKKINNLKF